MAKTSCVQSALSDSGERDPGSRLDQEESGFWSRVLCLESKKMSDDQERWFPLLPPSLPPSALQVEVVDCPGVASSVVLAIGKVQPGHNAQL